MVEWGPRLTEGRQGTAEISTGALSLPNMERLGLEATEASTEEAVVRGKPQHVR